MRIKPQHYHKQDYEQKNKITAQSPQKPRIIKQRLLLKSRSVAYQCLATYHAGYKRANNADNNIIRRLATKLALASCTIDTT